MFKHPASRSFVESLEFRRFLSVTFQQPNEGANSDETNLDNRSSTTENETVIRVDARIPGDANGDNFVNIADFNILRANFGRTNVTMNEGDFNGDQRVTLADFNILAANFRPEVVTEVDQPAPVNEATQT